VLDCVAYVAGHREQLGAVGVSVQGDVDRRPRGGQLLTEFVRGVGGEQSLAVKDPVALGDAVLDAYAEPVRRVEYELSPLGRSLLQPMAVTCAWAQEHWEQLLDAREASSPLGRAG
jgi:hypothetical protein